jgi:topoisomerase IA-like protein
MDLNTKTDISFTAGQDMAVETLIMIPGEGPEPFSARINLELMKAGDGHTVTVFDGQFGVITFKPGYEPLREGELVPMMVTPDEAQTILALRKGQATVQPHGDGRG